MNKIVLYAGSFDPITKGHLDIIKRASVIFEAVIVAVADNTRKTPFLNVKQRVELLNEATKDLTNVQATSYNGMTINYARAVNASALLRGLRNPTDFQFEFQMAITNRTLAPELETIFFTSAPAFAFINSSLVREVAKSGGNIAPFVPSSILSLLEEMISDEPDRLHTT